MEVSERRINHAKRARVQRMTKAQLIRELYTDHLTGIPNGRAYDDSDKREIQVMVDVDSLKWVNDNLGYNAGDALLRTVANVLESCHVETYRKGGDEFIVQLDDPNEVVLKLEAARHLLRKAMFTFSDKEGRVRTFCGIEISYGSGSTAQRAELRLAKQKTIREQIGTRTPRGVRPFGLTEVNHTTRSEDISTSVLLAGLSRPARQIVESAICQSA